MIIELKHPMCLKAAEQWQNGDLSDKYFQWVCSMVNSDNIPLVEAILQMGRGG